ncbi:4-hydroxythreonine-4-phosphate dehydrogenase PdxA [Candidatus Bathyarchaeota archaeon]|nr:4-hydroxythreonine-4-phosphate dehydrogenase PdxA [Candidatus Bathyarchaeota archaeon]
MTENYRPILGLTIGDPASIGPEIAVKALSNPGVYASCRPILIGDLDLLEKTKEQLKIGLRFRVIESPRFTEVSSGVIDVIDLKNVDVGRLRIGEVSADSGRASMEYIAKAVKFAIDGELEAVVTGPINKQAINLAGSRFIGHTEMIADLCGVKDPLTMFWVRGAKIFFLTRHLPLIDAVKAVKKEFLIKTTLTIVKEFQRIGIMEPVIAIAALNPHASDEGLVGHEEEEEIIPAIGEIQSQGIKALGPFPADSVFHDALDGKYDAVLSLYHDQGHIAAKTVDFYGTVSVTLGLPFIRTSVDHGTAYNIAGKGVANPRSMEEATIAAAKLVKQSHSTST